MNRVARFTYSRILGWSMKGTINPSVKKCVIIVAPHTSSYDFLLGVLVRRVLGIQIDYVAKKELFKPPFGWYFKWVGGTALDRTANQNKVDAIAQLFSEKEIFRLALSPEGTRKKTERWKTGFYYIAKAAKVPIIMVAFNYAEKEVKFSKPFHPTDDVEKDLREILSFYKGVQGKIPENF